MEFVDKAVTDRYHDLLARRDELEDELDEVQKAIAKLIAENERA